jgi:hypothetical protein
MKVEIKISLLGGQGNRLLPAAGTGVKMYRR